jgi:formylglycine-generating enzyme required for sulfatase activity
MPGSAVGTLGYLSPEQAGGRPDLDSRTDVFGVGATIYHALTGQLPYGKEAITEQTPLAAAPSKYQGALPGNLDAVILKALEPDRAKRYASSTELRDDWRRAREGLTPRARRVTPLARVGRSMHRHRWQVASAALLCLLAGVVVAMALRPSAPPGNGGVRHHVRVRTNPAGAEVALVRVNEYGEFQLEERIRPKGKTPLVIPDVPAGEYLVVVNVPGHGFHEVYRIVPARDPAAGHYLHNHWTEYSGNIVVEMPAIDIPRSRDVQATMVRVEGGAFRMGSDGRKGQSWVRTPVGPAHPRTVAPFDLDPTEVTVADYRTRTQTLPAGMKAHYPKEPENFGRYPVTHVTWDQAREMAERLGKRLPSEEEYEFAATAGGKWDYPWGNDPEKTKQIVGQAGPVREPAFDCVTFPAGKVFGLYSNVAEWSESRLIMYSPERHPSRLRTFVQGSAWFSLWKVTRAVRGGPYTDVHGGPARPAERAQELMHGPRGRFQCETTHSSAALGFRCARSASPRFLHPPG